MNKVKEYQLIKEGGAITFNNREDGMRFVDNFKRYIRYNGEQFKIAYYTVKGGKLRVRRKPNTMSNWKKSVRADILKAYKMYEKFERFGFTVKDCAFSCGCNYGTLRKYVSHRRQGIATK